MISEVRTDGSLRYAGLNGSGEETGAMDVLGIKTGALTFTVGLAEVEVEGAGAGDVNTVLSTTPPH